METGSYDLADKSDDTKHNSDDLGFDETKTPSPSPAVVPDSYRPASVNPAASNEFKAAAPVVEKRPEPVAVPDKPVLQSALKSTTSAAVTPSGGNKPAVPASFGGLALNGTAQEMKETLARRRKFDPRSQVIDMKKKYDLVNNM